MSAANETAPSAGGFVADRPAHGITHTMPQLLERLAAQRPDQIALQEKRYGIWMPMTWKVYRERVRDFAHGLAGLGVQRGDVVAVLGDNRPEWLIAELAAQSLGAAVVGIYPTSIGTELTHVLAVSRARVVVAEDQEQVDKLLAMDAESADGVLVEHIVFYDPHGLEQYDHPMLREFTAVEDAGREYAKGRDGWLDDEIARSEPESLAVICTTSGTTSKPKLAELSHANLLSMADRLTEVDPIDASFRYVSTLPFAWIGEQMLAVACSLHTGFTVSFPEDSSTQRADLREIGPDVMFAPPRIWESLLSEVQVRIDESGPLKRAIFGWGYDVMDRAATVRAEGKKPGAGLKLAAGIADLVATRPIREQLGLTRIKRCYTGGAPLGPDVFQFFHSIGVNLKQIYGQTEICGIAVLHRDDAVSFASVGEPLPGTEIQFGDKQEIMLRSSAVFRGYHRNDDATGEAVTRQGWLHTGDAGYLDDNGQLIVVDRLKDVVFADDGTMYSHAFIENKLKFSPYVEEAVVFSGTGLDVPEAADADAAMCAIITVDPATVGAWAEHNRISFTTYTDLASKPEVYDLVAEEIATANEGLMERIRVNRFVLLHKQFDPDDDEITRTRKVRRNVIGERYAPIITALAEGQEELTMESTVTYQDGTVAQRSLPLRIFDLTGYSLPAGRVRRKVWSGRK
ncbi:AMP-binding protein [Brevibacterium yomogidense]|uniref:Long-chain-fatty-acid--CoA ligase n=1 Tax=Brevibacterium yomogidense TaxID=946573 RepID=A0A1X6XHV5_9MICO|nr:AMP-binding protein [Brevibacterium yomogidense]SLM98872.1 Long-chain-fatty-acid--CoA ligase [Brevibacterium yomogidense]